MDANRHHKVNPCHHTSCHRMTEQCSPPQESHNTGVWVRIVRCSMACIACSSHAASCRNHLQCRLVKVALSVSVYCVSDGTALLRCTRYVANTRTGTHSWKVYVDCKWCGMVTHDVHLTKRTRIVHIMMLVPKMCKRA